MSIVNERATETALLDPDDSPATDEPTGASGLGLSAEELAQVARDLADPLGAALRKAGHRFYKDEWLRARAERRARNKNEDDELPFIPEGCPNDMPTVSAVAVDQLVKIAFFMEKLAAPRDWPTGEGALEKILRHLERDYEQKYHKIR